MALYNTSINSDGLMFLQQQKDLLSALTYEMQRATVCGELKMMALRLMQSLTCHIPSAAVLTDMTKQVRRGTTFLDFTSNQHSSLPHIFKWNSLPYT
jgi:hypothetical protein